VASGLSAALFVATSANLQHVLAASDRRFIEAISGEQFGGEHETPLQGRVNGALVGNFQQLGPLILIECAKQNDLP
jgi:hypothetical protein